MLRIWAPAGTPALTCTLKVIVPLPPGATLPTLTFTVLAENSASSASDASVFGATLRVMLPAGTVSGAPKVRAMEIIEELEPTRRGPYAGAVGYFSFNGNADFAITIRTLVATGDRAYIQVGAGIVADSDPEKEWFETESKAEALMKALGQAGEKL